MTAPDENKGQGPQMTPTHHPLVWITQHLQERDSVGSPGPCSSEPCGSNLSEQTDRSAIIFTGGTWKGTECRFFGLLIALDLECLAFLKHEVKKQKQKISL